MLIGIDLGTTNSLVACFRNGQAEIIPNRLGEHLTPSVVSIDSEGTVYVGRSAKERAGLHPLEKAELLALQAVARDFFSVAEVRGID